MVKRCSWGTCNSDSRYPDRLKGGISFKPFPKPKTNLERCKLWIKHCGRPHTQLNIDILQDYRRAKHLYVCSKHFVEGHADPVPAIPCGGYTSGRPPPKKRFSLPQTSLPIEKQSTCNIVRVGLISEHLISEKNMTDKDVQTDEIILDDGQKNLELLATVVENKELQENYARLLLEMEDLKRCKMAAEVPLRTSQFSYEGLKEEDFQYYTGFSFERFNNLHKFLIPSNMPFLFSKNMACLKHLSSYDQLLFVLMKLRQNYDFKHLSNIFSISQQDGSVLFNDWINFMFYRLGSLSIWPHRDIIIENMPRDYRKDFPNSVVIIDGTEIKIQKPSSLQSQSQCYSDYKSCTTLKGLVGVDPRGSVIFSSMLFSGSISDKEIISKSGFYNLLKDLLEVCKLKPGDGIMADKGFTIEKELKDLDLELNIPPFAPSSGQMKASDVTKTIKIAKHRVHVERAIARVKQFKLLSNKINLGLFKCIDQIWLVCCLLTNFMPYLISKEE